MRFKMSLLCAVLLTGCPIEDEGTSADDALSEMELYLVGVWVGSGGGDSVQYMVLQEDRTACEWVREGEDYGQRYDEVQFSTWSLDERLDEDGWMTLNLTGVDGEIFGGDAYDPEADLLYPSGLATIPLGWSTSSIPCDGYGTNSDGRDVERQGSAYDGENTDADSGGDDGDNEGSSPGQPGS